MTSNNKIINLKLDAKTIEKLSRQKSISIESLKSGELELVLDDARVKINILKQLKNTVTATYFNNNSSTLHYLGDAVPASTNVVMKPAELSAPKKQTNDKHVVVEREKMARRIELLDIPSTSSTPTSPKLPTKSTLKMPSSSSNNHHNTPPNNKKLTPPAAKSSSSMNHTNKDNIPTPPLPRTPQQQPKQKTPKPSAKPSPPAKPFSSPPVKPYSPPVNSNTPSESKYSTRARVLHRLALQPWSLIDLTKSLNRSNSSPREKLEQLDVKHILDTVAIQITKDGRKKYCLKPNLYKDIQVWTWPFYSLAEKHTVADNAKEAYDLLQSQGLDIDRSNLYHPDSPHKPATQSPLLKRRSLSPATTRKSAPLPPTDKGKGRSTPRGMATSPALGPSTPAYDSPTHQASPQKQIKTPILSTTPTQQQHLKPSSANKKLVSAKVSPQQQTSVEKTLSSTQKRKRDTDLPPPPPPPTAAAAAAASRDQLIMPPRAKKRPAEPTSSQATAQLPPLVPVKSNKSIKPSKPIKKEPRPIKPVDIKSQRSFDAYCHSYVTAQTDYSRIKRFFKNNFPHYIQVLQTTEPPKGKKRSYYDLKREYQGMVKANYLKKDDEEAFKEAEDFLMDCSKKRRRLNYMWISIVQNVDKHKYKIPDSLIK